MHRTRIRQAIYDACASTGRETLVNFTGEIESKRIRDAGLINILDGDESVTGSSNSQYLGEGCCMFPVDIEERFFVELYYKSCHGASEKIDEIQRLVVKGLQKQCYGKYVKAFYEGSSPDRQQRPVHSAAYRRIDLMFQYKLEAI